MRLVNNVLNRFFDWRIVIFRKFSYKKWEKVLEVLRRLFLVFIINDLMLIELVKEAIIIFNKSSIGYFVSSREFIIVRDFFIVRFELENA